ncbi:MAG: glycoside hydrolase family 28 protein [Bryobacteraceae bacterium]
MTRRQLLQSAALAVPVVRVGAQTQKASAGQQKEQILSRIKPPRFRDEDFDIRRFGAVSGGEKPATDAIRAAIKACSQAGGGRVVVPAGTFVTGAVHLESNVNLHLSKDAILKFSRNTKDYPIVFTRFESTECMNFSPFIYAFEKQNVAVTGPGTLDGQADAEHWWPMRKKQAATAGEGNPEDDRKRLVEMGNNNVPVKDRVFGEGHTLRPNFVQPYRCQNVLLEEFTMINSPMWELNPVLCKNVTVRKVTIDSHGPNNDGCDPECCDDVLIADCVFSTGDDCIAIKSGRNVDGRRVNVPCSNVVIQNCMMKDGHGGVSIGSEVSGGIRSVFIEQCQMSSPHLERGLRIKTNSYRGGVIDNIHFSHVTIGEVAQAAVEVDFFYEEGKGGPFKPDVKNIYISDVTSKKSKYGIFLRGFPDAPITGANISHCKFDNAANGNLFQDVASVNLEDVLVNGKSVTFNEARQSNRN